MKKLILSELLLLFLATTFVTDTPPPGWYQQTLPVNDQINDIFFLDSLTGWVVTAGASSVSDTGYIMKTTNGGINWQVQYNSIMNFNVVQFADGNTGYAGGGNGFGRFFKTINGGLDWTNIFSFGFITVTDLFFVNKDTGWVCSNDPLGGGIIKTTSGGVNWFLQAGSPYHPKKLFFINSDTGWAGSEDWKLYRTTNSGQNWNLQYSFSGSSILSIFFKDGLNGLIGGAGSNNIQYTTNGGFNWLPSQGEIGGYDIKFVNDSVGWAGGGNMPLRIIKSTDGGKTWGYQVAQAGPDISVAVLYNDTLLAWGGRQLLIHTSDGGGSIIFSGIKQINTDIPTNFMLYQNYPNPFNPNTIISYELPVTSYVKLEIYDIQGKEITTLVKQKQSPGTYQVDFSGEGLSSGVYFYKITITAGKEVYSDTKRMILVK